MDLLRVTEKAPLLEYLITHLKDRSRTRVKQLLQHGSIEVNGRTVTAFDHPLKPGDAIALRTRAASSLHKARGGLPFEVVHEDDSLLVIDKPAGLLSMGTDRDRTRTAYFAATEYVRRKGRGRVFIVHRLDRETSGLMVLAKDASAKQVLQEGWEDVRKKYYAVVEGVPSPSRGAIRTRLAEDEFRRVYTTFPDDPHGKDAVTHYNLLRQAQGLALLEVDLETGRKNQVRVQLAGIGHPIIGDDKYGARTDPAGRLGLHAFLLSFPHPADGRTMTFRSPLPPELEGLFPAQRAARR